MDTPLTSISWGSHLSCFRRYCHRRACRASLEGGWLDKEEGVEA